MKYLSLLFSGLFVLLLICNSYSQISKKGLPPSFEENINNNLHPEFVIPAPDVQKLMDEDEFTDKHGIAMRFAVSTNTTIDLAKEGAWLSLNDGSKICRLAIHSDNAQALILYYKEFVIPEDGNLYLYGDNKKQVIGAFTDLNNKNGGAFATEMIYGETTILEYHQPYGTNEQPEIIIGELSYVYRTAERISGDKGFGGSDTCEVNIGCPEGDNWQDQAKGVARIIVKQGSSSVWCSGSLLNNTREDLTPYFFTADHCGPNASPNDYDSWIFYFKYQGDACDNPPVDTTFNSFTIVGASKIAASGGSGFESDFKLLLLNDPVPEHYQPYFNGWSAIEDPSPEGVTIHHPQGDIKKISTYNQPLVSTNWGSVPNTHWRVVWAETETNWGVTEGGSSGSPLFNNNGLIVGHLTGGDASCSFVTGPDYYGKFSWSWDQTGTGPTTKLKPWLDPDNTGILELGGAVSVEDVQTKHPAIRIFPNPSSGITHLDFGTNFHDSNIHVFVLDISGRMVYETSSGVDNSGLISMDLTHLRKGVYFVVIKNGQNESQTIKLIR
jgi:hypothetical protein